MKIGIGVPTLGRRPLRGYWEFCTHPTLVAVQVDLDRRGPGWARNQLIAALYDAGCDLIVLMDDDCYPTRSGWQDHLLDHEATGMHNPLDTPVATDGDFLISHGLGCFLAITRRTVDTVGYFAAEFAGYGFEDVNYRQRIIRSGITGYAGGLPCPSRLAEFVRSEDVEKPAGFDEYANLTRAEKDDAIARNLPAFLADSRSPRIYRDRSGR